MRLFVLSFLLIATASVAIISCKKDDNGPTTRAEMIAGTWKTTEVGVDSNANGVWDASEHKPSTGSPDAVTIKFNADGTGTSTYDVFATPFAIIWSLQNNETDLRIISNVFGPDTMTVNIVSLSNSEAVVRDLSETPVSYLTLKKQ